MAHLLFVCFYSLTGADECSILYGDCQVGFPPLFTMCAISVMIKKCYHFLLN